MEIRAVTRFRHGGTGHYGPVAGTGCANARLKPGDVLPSVRRLALDLGIHFNTVAEAYRALAEEGWLDLRHGCVATVVQRAQPPVAHPELVQKFRRRLRALVC